MKYYNLDNLGSDTQRWLENRFLAAVPWQQWGWEYWWQIDFPAWLDTTGDAGHADNQYDFQRERWVGDIRVDWLINANTTNQPVAVNLKAQTVLTPQATFLLSVERDQAKLSSLQGYRKLMLVAVIDKATESYLTNRHGPNFVSIAQISDTVSILLKEIP